MKAPEQTEERQAERRFARTVLLLIILGFALVMLAGLSAVGMIFRTEEQVRWVDHTQQVESEVRTIRLALEEMRSARRGVVLKIRYDSGATYDEASGRLFRAIEGTAALTRDNPAQQADVRRIRALSATLDRLFRLSMVPNQLSSDEAVLERQQLAGQVEAMAEKMLRAERRLLDERAAARDRSVTIFFVVLGVSGVLLLLVAGGSIWVIRRYTGQLLASREELRQLNENLEDAVAERTTDLRRANDEIQRFAYIVSHDLRSPLVNVMGFTAELEEAIKPLQGLIERADENHPGLVDAEMRSAVWEDLPEAVGFIRTSTEKMDRLINAILRLSREGRRAITPERLDLAAMARGVIDALRHRIDELGVKVTTSDQLPDLVSDRLALEQILSNLVENAVKYLKPGRPGEVWIGGRAEHGRVLIEVRDNGRGIDPRDHERVFELFRRSGEQDQPGEGIGLAHVRALAYRLGGTISVESELDQGATFIVNLPASFAGERAA
ncbi:histidine kinase [Rhizorhabdus dicambivorans]|uniref:histidine kinase n=2 Tax=Rhizorhabdus dicambivorans TaxID=1850238 RepID=A0A2A4FYN4_9SPHN|nr:histidine kinase [Rhizorhabdus dicambivorans]PCE42817.1 histidine kinase [Rhizorhabdus dicambivorans]